MLSRLKATVIKLTAFLRKPAGGAHIEYLVVGILILLSAFLCLWRVSDGMQFLGDQGRDALIVARIFTEGDLVFIGPVTSVGNMYLGPLYYYFMLPFLWFSYPSPVGPVIGVTLVHLATLFLLYHWGKQMIGRRAALVAIALYSIHAVTIYHARFSWNPNITPFFSLVLLYSLWQVWNGKRWYLLGVAGAFSALLQLHYITLLVLPTVGLVWLRLLVIRRKQLWAVMGPSLVAVAVVIGSLIPLILFDMKHEWVNATAFSNMFFGSDNFNKPAVSAVEGAKWLRSLKETHGRSLQLFFETSIGSLRWRNTTLLLGLLGVVVFHVWKNRRRLLDNSSGGFVIPILYIFWAIIGLSLYENSVFDHYILFLFPAVMLIYGWVGTMVWKLGGLYKLGLIALFGFYVWSNLQHLPYQPSNWPPSRFKHTAEVIKSSVKSGQPYDLLLVSESGDQLGMSYRYYLYTIGSEPVAKENIGSAQQLVVIVEEPDVDLADVFNAGLYELVVFPRAEQYQILETESGIRVLIFNRSTDVAKY